MKSYSRSHLSDQSLLRDLVAHLSRCRSTTAELLADLGEVDARRLYVPTGYPSMFAYCVQELHLSEDSAFKRIHAARTARQFPAILPALAEGRLHLSAVIMLAPHLTPENADEFLAAAAHQSKSQIERLIAERFPRPDVAARVQRLSVASRPALVEQHAPGRVKSASEQVVPASPAPLLALKLEQGSTMTGPQHAPGRVPSCADRPKVTPLAPQRYALQCTIAQETHDKLRHAQELLSHEIPNGDIARVLDRVLDLANAQLEKRKFAASSRPSPCCSTTNARHVPAHVKRAVWQRDGGQCTFTSETGRRCSARTLLEFDHVQEVARGGQATVSGIRLRCRAHNQYSAERTFGVEFMRHKRQLAAEARARAVAKRQAQEQTQERARAAADEVIPWLRQLGIRADEARRAAARCQAIPDAPLEERVRLALSCFGPGTSSRGQAMAVPTGP